jgi:hypothetical protein
MIAAAEAGWLEGGPRDSETSEDLSLRDTVRLAARIASALTLLTAAVAAVVNLAFAGTARHWLGFPFTGVSARPSEAVAILLHNLRWLLAIGGLLLVAQTRHWPGEAGDGRLHRGIQRLGEALLGAGVAINVAVVGAGLGAYGERMVSAILPHGPFELAAYSLALALYLQGRDKPLPARQILGIAATAILMLAIAAVLETFVNV